MRVDLLLKNGVFFNPYFKKFIPGYATVLDGRFLHIGKGETDMEQFEADEVVDCQGKFVVPGLIDIHMHIESTQASPVPFTDYLVKYGITTIVSEPHEIANVFGLEAILAMIEAGKGSPVDVYYGMHPACLWRATALALWALICPAISTRVLILITPSTLWKR